MGDAPSSISTRQQFARALAALREERLLTIRQVVERSGGSLATVGGWYSGRHVPTPQNSQAFFALLTACGVDDEAERAQWWAAVLRVRKLAARRPDQTPYKGLDSFEPEDAEWFFGRDQLVAELLSRVEAGVRGHGPRLIAVTGASGSGKSSLLRAGLMAALDVDSSITRPTLPMPDGHAPVLIVDQAEELWAPDVPGEARAAYLADVERRSTDAVIVIGVRADFYASALTEPVLLRALSAGPLVVGPMSADEMRKAITGPAERAGAAVDATLVDVLLNDLIPSGSTVTAEPGILPLLSHALLGTWQRASTPTLTVADYRATGGISGAVQQSAEEVFAAMSPAQQLQVRRVLLRLVTIDGDTVTRRRMPLGELASEGTDLALLQRFAAARLLTVDEDVVQVTHEALLTVWTRLRGWIDADRAWFVNHRVLTQAAGVWSESGRDSSALLGASRLGFYDELLAVGDRADDLNGMEREFLAGSRARLDKDAAKERRRARTRRRLVTALAAATVAAVVLAGTALVTTSDAVEQRAAAETAKAQAESRQIVAQALDTREQDPAVAAQLALAAYRVGNNMEARSVLLDSSGLDRPTRIVGEPGVSVVRESSDGAIIVAGGASGSIRIYDSASPTTVLATITAPSSAAVTAVAIGSSRGVLAVGGDFGVALYDLADPSVPEIGATVPTGTRVQDLALRADGRELAAGMSDGTASVWAVESATLSDPRSLLLPGGAAVRVAYSVDGRFLVTAGGARALRMWETDSIGSGIPPVVDRPADDSTYDYFGLAFSPDGRSLAAGGTGREIARWSVDPSGRLTDQPALGGYSSYVNDVAYSADGNLIASASSDLSTRVWDVRNGIQIMNLPGPAIVGSVRFGHDDRTLLTGDEDGTIRMWPLPGPVLGGPTDTLYTNPADRDGTTLVGGVGARGSGAYVWDVSDPSRPVASPNPLTTADGSLLTGASAISSDGSMAAFGTSAGGFQLWDVENPLAPRRAAIVSGALPQLVGGVAFDRENKILALTQQDGPEIALWTVDSATPHKLSDFAADGLPAVVSFSPTRDLVAFPTSSGVVELWDTSDPTVPKRVQKLTGFASGATSVAFSADGRIVAAGGSDSTVRLWDIGDVTSPRVLSTMTASAGVMSTTIDPSGTRLAAGIATDELWIWDIRDPAAPTQFATLTANGARVNDAAFLGDGIVAGGGGGGRVHLWSLAPDAVADRICETAGSPLTQEEWAQYLPGLEYRALC
ncbi:helix-turn-helix domain-containing protein [Actinomycetes bacterium M1A6_2h]